MRLMNKNEFEFAKEQLLNKRSFVRHCRDSYVMPGNKIPAVTDKFVEAAINDKFLSPLYIEETPDGKESYFSPFQMFVLSGLSGNLLDENDLLKSDSMIGDVHPGFRWIKWGTARTFNFNIERENIDKHSSIINLFKAMRDFHNLILFLHTFKPYPEYENFDETRIRHFTAAPDINYDFSSFEKTKDKKSVLGKFDLALESLISLRGLIGSHAMDIDPLSRWVNYLSHHPVYKRDLLMGQALVAQELYLFIETLSRLISIVDGTDVTSVTDMIYSRKILTPYLVPTSNFVHGTDLVSLKKAITEFGRWRQEEKNEEFVPDNFDDELRRFGKRLKDFESRYGDRFYKSNRHEFRKLEWNIKYDDLCDKAKNYVGQIEKQREAYGEEFDDEDYAAEIAQAIERVLSGLAREGWKLFDAVSESINDAANKAKLEEERFGIKGNSGLLELAKLQKVTSDLYKKRDEFNKRVKDNTFKLYCAKCRENLVLESSNRSSPGFMEKLLCSDCLKKVNEGVLDPSTGIQKDLIEGYWHCSCGAILYKFAYGNLAFSYTQGGVPVKFEIPYGRVILTARCKECKRTETKMIDCGWD